MLRTFLIVILLLFISETYSQTERQWTSKSRRAIRNIERALEYHMNYDTENAYIYASRALRADSSFVEAYMLLGELAMMKKETDVAILAFEYIIAIDPSFFPGVFYHLGNLYISKEDYKKALTVLNRYKQQRNINRQTLALVERSIENCLFAIDAIANPVDFNPINLGRGVNTPQDEYWPSLTVDEKTLLFTRRDIDQRNYDGFSENLYVSTFSNYVWQSARSLGAPINTRYNEGASAISPDGQMLVFTCCEILGRYPPGRRGYGSCDLFFSYRMGNEWSDPQNMGAPINTSAWESQPAFDVDGKTLYFTRSTINRFGEVQNSNIFYTIVDEDGKWSLPKPIGAPINTSGNEQSVFMHPDGQTMYFSSDGHIGMGGYDIFMSRRLADGSWDEPVNLGYPINTSKDEIGFVVGGSGRNAYFASDREGGYGGLDIYTFELDERLRPMPVTYLQGTVYDSETTRPLMANFELINIQTGNVVVQSYSDPVTGRFLISLPSDQIYALNVNRENYLFYSDHFKIDDGFTALKPFEKDIPLQPIKTGEAVVLKNIFFDHDQFNLKPESVSELQRLVKLLKQNPSIKIEIGGHTDNTGTREYNVVLSENRAKAVYNYLVDAGIDSSRLSYRGYADTIPIADNRTAEGRAENRRTEFKITDN